VTFEYKVVGKTAEITGYSHIGSASDDLGDLRIPEMIDGYTVTSIGPRAFAGAGSFTGSLTLPDTLTYIDEYAFDGCVSLKGSLVIPDSVKYIGPYAFRECYGMDGELVIGENTEEICDYAFFGCNNLHGNIDIPAKVKKIGALAFSGCTGFEGNLKFRTNHLEEIGTSAFSGLNITGGIGFPGKIDSIGNSAFKECKRLDGTLYFGGDVGFIGAYAFAYCGNLKGSITLNNSLVGDNSFKSCKKLGPVLTLGKNTEWDDSLGMYSHSFLYCCGIKKVVNKSNDKFTLNGLKSDSYKDPWGTWTDQKGNYVYELANGTATRSDYEEIYSITMQDGSKAYDTDEYRIEEAKPGDTVNVVWLYDGEDKEFVKWESKSKNVKFKDPYDEDTTFVMPAEDVEITYVEKAVKYYTITMQAGSEAYDEDGYLIEEAKEGDTVNVVWLYEGEDKEFVKWESKSKKVKFTDPYDEDTTFVMPAEDVAITYVERENGTPEPDPEPKVCPNVVTKQKVDLSLTDYFGAEFENKDSWTVEPKTLGSVSKGIFTAKKPGEVTVTWMDKDKDLKGIAKFAIEVPEIDYPINPKNGKKLTTFTYNRIDETIDVSSLISTPSGLTPAKYECTDKNGKNFRFDAENNTLTVKKTGTCKINVYYNYGDNERNAAKIPISIKASLPKLKEKQNLKENKSTTIAITNVQDDLDVTWGAFVYEYDEDEYDEWPESEDLIIEEVPESNGRKCKITAAGSKGTKVWLTAFVGDEYDEYDCLVTIN
ncbi:MAG: leucine-rich repeat domain-containing protein, partial [Lachnospiraceae bacterium]|nr:leucine-rich repeat domain-containing protein [Lachnospiraceae bacterium]